MSNTKKNIALQCIYQFAALIVPFITAPYITRVLGAKNVGIYSYTFSIVNYFMVFSMLGIEYYGNRSIAQARNNQNEVNRIFSEIFYCHLIPSSIALVGYLFICFQLPSTYTVVCLIHVLYIIGELLNINWLFAGLEEFKVTVIRNSIIKIVTVIAIFLLVKTKEDLLVYIVIMAFGSFLSQSAVWIVFHNYAKFIRVSWKGIISHLKPMLILFIAVISTNIYRMIDKTMLGSTGELQILGCYEYADKILRIPLSVVIAIGSVMLSKTANMIAIEDEEKVHKLLIVTIKYVTLFSSLMIGGVILYGKDFAILFLGNDFEETGVLLSVLSFSFLFMAWNTVFRTQYFMPKSEDKYYVISVCVGAVINICMNFILIPQYNAYGAAISTNISYACVTITQLIFAKKDINLLKLFKRCLITLLIGVFPFAIMKPLHGMFSVSWLDFAIQVILYCLIFGVLTILYWKEDKKRR